MKPPFARVLREKKDKHGRIWHQFYEVFICRNIEVKPEAPAGVINVRPLRFCGV